ncbi:MAG: RNA polymerase alpha subunit C-terminal domain-containing protein [Bacteroidota bacterium]
MPAAKNLRICSNGHTYYKSSSCPVCPVCEKEKIPAAAFLTLISAPARRALESKNIDTLEKLSKYSESDLLSLHGFGPGSLPKLNHALKEKGLSFKKK